ncbi:MAG: hypothetical protein RL434_903 [Pseudomonadota bacterium]|jgi:hypothetical protein
MIPGLARRHLSVLLLLPLGFLPGGAGATPEVVDVIRICEAALVGGYDDEQASACDWYVRPCGACGVDAPRRWCIPDDVSRRTVAEYVVAGLSTLEPGDPTPLADAVDALLGRRYPCQDDLLKPAAAGSEK